MLPGYKTLLARVPFICPGLLMQNHPGRRQKFYDVQAAKVKTLIRPDGKKKAYVCLTTDHDALDVENKVCRRVLAAKYTFGFI
ncbi:hypothetical protein B0H14DRAFT_3489076 [Mycena olivaceomarginata]|nr:hypothetical protein B0H14DRAFT_3489076 [Mycena olivaceomarginata]